MPASGHESTTVPCLSPAHRRSGNASQSPFTAPARKAALEAGWEEAAWEKPGTEWADLVKRHKFLLFMLAILTFVCIIYLYFAVTLATS